MNSFSQRKGIKPAKKALQSDSMDQALRNALWDGVYKFYVRTLPYFYRNNYRQTKEDLLTQLWVNFLNEPIDTRPGGWTPIRQYFFDCQWYEVYDLIEFIVNRYADESENKKFIDLCNSVLKRESSAYRFVGTKIAQLTSEEEIAEIEEALNVPDPLKPVATHLETALGLLANKKSPDYRNSIKESISAVEAICQLMTGKRKATLGQALKVIEDKVGLHPALKSAFSSLYGYTSDADGIRHALLDESKLDFEDAKFMLVSCSAFVNYLVSKSSKAEIKL